MKLYNFFTLGRVSFLTCISLSVCAQAFAEETLVVFEKKIAGGQEIIVSEKEIQRPSEEEYKKLEERDSKERGQQVFYARPLHVYEYHYFVITKEGIKNDLFSPQYYDYGTAGYGLGSDMPYIPFKENKYFDAIFEGETLVMFSRARVWISAEVINAGKITRTKGLKCGSPSVKINGSYEKELLILTITADDGKIARWHWDGKDWVEEKNEQRKK